MKAKFLTLKFYLFSFVQLENQCFEDWIVDGAWENNLSYVVLALAHNSLLRYKIQSLDACCVTNLKLEDEQNEVNRNTETASYNQMEKTNQGIDSNHFTNTIAQALNLDKPHASEQQKQCITLGINKSVVAKAECTEKCVLFCGRVVMMSGSWESAVLLAGMVSQQVVVWGPWGQQDHKGRIVPLHRISGHQVSTLEVVFATPCNFMFAHSSP